MRLILAIAAVALAAAPAHAQKKQKPAKPAVATADTSKAAASDAWTASRSSKKMEYYKSTCSKAREIKAKNVVRFKTEADAQKAGYKRSTLNGC